MHLEVLVADGGLDRGFRMVKVCLRRSPHRSVTCITCISEIIVLTVMIDADGVSWSVSEEPVEKCQTSVKR